LVLAGPDEQRLLRNRELPKGVRYVGAVEGAEKSRLLQHASVFILPSHSENFGVVVAEALMAGVPVIATHGTPWQSLENERCGWWIEMNEVCLRDALLVALETPATELRAMGRRGREFAVRAFSWERIASQMAEVYEWVLGGGAPPACVEVRP
jgi:glycosyltransferase involved in cell wall biosynthesis